MVPVRRSWFQVVGPRRLPHICVRSEQEEDTCSPDDREESRQRAQQPSGSELHGQEANAKPGTVKSPRRHPTISRAAIKEEARCVAAAEGLKEAPRESSLPRRAPAVFEGCLPGDRAGFAPRGDLSNAGRRRVLWFSLPMPGAFGGKRAWSRSGCASADSTALLPDLFLQGLPQELGTAELGGLNCFVHGCRHRFGHPGANEYSLFPRRLFLMFPAPIHALSLTELNNCGQASS